MGSTNGTWERSADDPCDGIDVTCATDVTDTTLAYRFLDGDNTKVQLCGDNERIVGWPNKKAKAGQSFKLRRRGDIIATASAAFSTNNIAFTAAAGGKIRPAVTGTDHEQGFNNNTAAADGDKLTVSRT